MPKVSIYLPDETYRRAKDRGLPLSALAQEAVENALRVSDRITWVTRVRDRTDRTSDLVDTAALLDEVRQEFGE
jgi:post-segregation antitoxin (ccd killing protein)